MSPVETDSLLSPIPWGLSLNDGMAKGLKIYHLVKSRLSLVLFQEEERVWTNSSTGL